MSAKIVGARERFAQWVIGRSGIPGLSVVEAVRIRDGLRLRVDESHEGVCDLRDSEGERGKPVGGVGEFTLREPRGVLGLERMPLSVHKQVEASERIISGGHDESVCLVCTAAEAARDTFVAERAV